MEEEEVGSTQEAPLMDDEGEKPAEEVQEVKQRGSWQGIVNKFLKCIRSLMGKSG